MNQSRGVQIMGGQSLYNAQRIKKGLKQENSNEYFKKNNTNVQRLNNKFDSNQGYNQYKNNVKFTRPENHNNQYNNQKRKMIKLKISEKLLLQNINKSKREITSNILNLIEIERRESTDNTSADSNSARRMSVNSMCDLSEHMSKHFFSNQPGRNLVFPHRNSLHTTKGNLIENHFMTNARNFNNLKKQNATPKYLKSERELKTYKNKNPTNYTNVPFPCKAPFVPDDFLKNLIDNSKNTQNKNFIKKSDIQQTIMEDPLYKTESIEVNIIVSRDRIAKLSISKFDCIYTKVELFVREYNIDAKLIPSLVSSIDRAFCSLNKVLNSNLSEAHVSKIQEIKQNLSKKDPICNDITNISCITYKDEDDSSFDLNNTM